MPPAGKQLRVGALVYLVLGLAYGPGLLCNASDGETMQKYANESLAASAEVDVDAPVWSQFLEDYVLRWVRFIRRKLLRIHLNPAQNL